MSEINDGAAALREYLAEARRVYAGALAASAAHAAADSRAIAEAREWVDMIADALAAVCPERQP